MAETVVSMASSMLRGAISKAASAAAAELSLVMGACRRIYGMPALSDSCNQLVPDLTEAGFLFFSKIKYNFFYYGCGKLHHMLFVYSCHA